MAQNDKPNENTAPPQDENQIIAERRAKLAELRKSGNAFPNDFDRADFAGDLHQAYDAKTKEDLEASPVTARIAGRMLLKRVMGKASFATLQDMSGRMQIYVANDITGAEVHAAFKHWDIGDILGVEGLLFKTRTGELTIQVKSLRLLTKALRPLPEKFHGLTDQEGHRRSVNVTVRAITPALVNDAIEETRQVRRMTYGLRQHFVRKAAHDKAAANAKEASRLSDLPPPP